MSLDIQLITLLYLTIIQLTYMRDLTLATATIRDG